MIPFMKISVKYHLSKEHGYNLLEVLVVCIIISIIATVPVVSLRNAKVKANEVDAISALNVMAVAYENYNNQARPHRYPNYLANGAVYTGLIDYRSAEEIWDTLISQSLLPRRYANHSHDEWNLMAKGFKLSIMPYSRIPNYANSPRYNYAIVMKPFPGSPQPRAIAIFQGYNDTWMRISPRARKLPGSGDRSKAKFYTWKDF